MEFRNDPQAALRQQRLFRAEASRPLSLLQSCPAYEPAPLLGLPELAARSGVSQLFVKDESKRMGLGSFKALGGAFAVAQMVRDAAGSDDPCGEAAKAAAAGMTFITASAGNHGLSVAAGAKVFGARAVIVLAAAVPEAFAARIRALGAEVMRVEGGYEESVAAAMRTAGERGWLLLADGSWEGYLERPALVMEGYTVVAEECRQSFCESGAWPSHVYLQAGVGGLAAALAAPIRETWERQPEIVVVEPEAAPCLLESMKAGELRAVAGPLSNMGRLDCKEASLIAFQSLRQDADLFLTVSDAEAQAAAESFAGLGLPTTPSGAAGLAGLLRHAPGPEARCLVILSEGPE
jgi:diaminopropionate ammonia-lyase